MNDVVYGNESAVGTRNEKHSGVLNEDKRSVVLFKEIERRCMNTRGIQANGKNDRQDVRLTVYRGGIVSSR